MPPPLERTTTCGSCPRSASAPSCVQVQFAAIWPGAWAPSTMANLPRRPAAPREPGSPTGSTSPVWLGSHGPDQRAVAFAVSSDRGPPGQRPRLPTHREDDGHVPAHPPDAPAKRRPHRVRCDRRCTRGWWSQARPRLPGRRLRRTVLTPVVALATKTRFSGTPRRTRPASRARGRAGPGIASRRTAPVQIPAGRGVDPVRLARPSARRRTTRD